MPTPELTADEIRINAAVQAQYVRDIDEAVAQVYARFGRFTLEYELREAQAQAFKDAGYTGSVPRQVAAFATRAGQTSTDATNLILAQATQLRGALGDLGDLRMRKYEVIGAASFEAAQAAYANIMAAIRTVADAVT